MIILLKFKRIRDIDEDMPPVFLDNLFILNDEGTVKEEVSKKLVEEVKEVNKKTFPWLWVMVGVMLVVILGLVIYIVKSNKNRK